MKITQLRSTVCRQLNRFIAMGAVALLAIACAPNAVAQSGLLNFLKENDGGAAGTSRATLPATRNQNATAGWDANSIANLPVMQASAVKTAADLPSAQTRSSSPIASAYGRAGLGPGAISRAVGTVSTDANAIQQVSNSCGGHCGGTCNSCQTYGGDFSMGCGVPCPAYRYGWFEALYLERRGGNAFSLAQNFRMPSFDFEWGPRVTVGYVPDCVHGYEASFTGPIEWERETVARDAAGGLNALFVPGNPLPATDLDNFYNGVIQQQRHESEYFSVEASKVWVGWDAAKLLIGARYIDLEENYFYLSQNNIAETGVVVSDTSNQMFGLQVGLDLQQPIGRITYADFRGRAGAYYNFAESDVNIQNDGSFVVFNHQEDEDFAGVFEVGSGIRYQLGPMLTVRYGAEVWYMTGLATATDQLDFSIAPTTGSQLRNDDDLFFYGLTFGGELRY